MPSRWMLIENSGIRIGRASATQPEFETSSDFLNSDFLNRFFLVLELAEHHVTEYLIRSHALFGARSLRSR